MVLKCVPALQLQILQQSVPYYVKQLIAKFPLKCSSAEKDALSNANVTPQKKVNNLVL